MAHVSAPGEMDQALAHQFIRVFGRRPTAEERARYEGNRRRAGMCLGGRARRCAALVIRWLGDLPGRQAAR